jgi:uncharacterized protein YfaS (alpha-2-macroglobulin family)
MKQAITTTKMLSIGLIAVCGMGFSKATFAQMKPGDPTELTYIGKNINDPVFQLKLNNQKVDEYFITIKDENLNVLYSEKIKGTNLIRKYQLDIEEADINEPQFGLKVEVTSAKTHNTETYNISTKTSVREDIVVAKL